MPYDEKSFLSGLAVGRNVKSWPVANETTGDIVLFMGEPGQFRAFIAGTNIDIDWGVDSVVEPSRYQHIDDASGGVALSHFFTLADVMWLIKFSGNITDFKCYDSNYSYQEQHGVYGVLTPMPDTMSALVDCDEMFYNCQNLKVIHPQLFDKLVNVESFESTFGRCGSLHTIPDGLFRYNVKAKSFKQCFQLAGLTSVPLTLFDRCPDINDLTSCFYWNSITSAVPELWNTYPNAAHAECFYRNTSAANYADIPADWK